MGKKRGELCVDTSVWTQGANRTTLKSWKKPCGVTQKDERAVEQKSSRFWDPLYSESLRSLQQACTWGMQDPLFLWMWNHNSCPNGPLTNESLSSASQRQTPRQKRRLKVSPPIWQTLEGSHTRMAERNENESPGNLDNFPENGLQIYKSQQNPKFQSLLYNLGII